MRFTDENDCQIEAVFSPISPLVIIDEKGIAKLETKNEDVIGQTAILDTNNQTIEYVIVDDELLRNKVSHGDDIEHIVTTYVEDMSGLFAGNKEMEQNISSWDVSNVIDMSRMFEGNTRFNQDIGHWGVGKVTKMDAMFYRANSFNQDISSWDTNKVTNMDAMFYGLIPLIKTSGIGRWIRRPIALIFIQ